jgi:hypothetical protein
MARRAKPRDGLRKKYLAYRGETRLQTRLSLLGETESIIDDKKLDSRLRGNDETASNQRPLYKAALNIPMCRDGRKSEQLSCLNRQTRIP